MSFTYRVLLKPSDICFKKKLLPSSFDNGIPLRETLQQLANEEILVEDLPGIDVVWCAKKWVWYTLNNRRLWVFRELEKLGKCQYIATKRVETIEHMTDFLLYGSAELIGESNVVEWDDDGFRITLFNNDAESAKKDTTPASKVEEDQAKATKEEAKIPRDWREMTPLTVTVKWNEAGKQSDAERSADERLVTPDSDKQPVKREARAESVESKRERKDSGFSDSHSGGTSPRYADSSCSESECGETVFSRGSSRRFSRFKRDRSLSPPRSHGRRPSKGTSRTTSLSSTSTLSLASSTRYRYRLRRRVSRPVAVDALKALAFRRREIYDQSMFLLHHGEKSRLEQLALKTKLMNTCGFCFKSFREGVSLSQHIEVLQHWACTRCGKYFGSYTALGQHKLALEHCNV